ncbi:MAG: cation transporter [Thermoleophilia bacterium]
MMESDSFVVPAISCGHCKGVIEGALALLEGVAAADVDVAAKSVTVRYDGAVADRAAIIAAIEDVGYDVPKAAGSSSAGG